MTIKSIVNTWTSNIHYHYQVFCTILYVLYIYLTGNVLGLSIPVSSQTQQRALNVMMARGIFQLYRNLRGQPLCIWLVTEMSCGAWLWQTSDNCDKKYYVENLILYGEINYNIYSMLISLILSFTVFPSVLIAANV